MRRAAQRRAFTLIEVGIVIAIIGILVTVLLSGVEVFMPDRLKDPPKEVLRKAVDAAWYAAATGHGRHVLTYDPDANALVLRSFSNGGGSTSNFDLTADGTNTANNTAADANDPNDDDLDPDLADKPPARGGSGGNGISGRGPHLFRFDDPNVTEVRFLRPPDEGGGTLQTTLETSLEQIVFSPWSGATPAVIEMDISGDTYRYALEVFGGALTPLK
jgi:prepilin-type N-terminal cleavage/methylation domain-containing protein